MSDRKIAASKRRDVRHDKPSDEPVKVPAKTKDTKRWCKGKVGVEHAPKCVPHEGTALRVDGRSLWRDLVCSKCGKVLDRYWPWRQSTEPKPAWVDC